MNLSGPEMINGREKKKEHKDNEKRKKKKFNSCRGKVSFKMSSQCSQTAPVSVIP